MDKNIAKLIGRGIIIASFFIPKVATAACHDVCDPATTICIPNPLQWCNIQEIIEAIVRFLFLAAVILAPLMVVVGAYYLITSGGSEQRVSTGKKIIIYAIVGFLLALLARGVLGVITGILGL